MHNEISRITQANHFSGSILIDRHAILSSRPKKCRKFTENKQILLGIDALPVHALFTTIPIVDTHMHLYGKTLVWALHTEIDNLEVEFSFHGARHIWICPSLLDRAEQVRGNLLNEWNGFLVGKSRGVLNGILTNPELIAKIEVFNQYARDWMRISWILIMIFVPITSTAPIDFFTSPCAATSTTILLENWMPIHNVFVYRSNKMDFS